MAAPQNYLAVIKVVGIGGGGVNAINRMIEAGLKGVEEKYVLSDSKDAVALPSNLNEAIAAMENSELVKETLGAHVFEYVLRNKRAEWLEYSRQVSAFELDRYLPVL